MFPALSIGGGLFVLNHIAILSGALAPPHGYLPQYALRNVDVPSYLNWMTSGRHNWLAPNFGAPWITPNELFAPIFIVMGRLSDRLPWSILTDYYLMHFALTVGATLLLIAAMRYFLPSRKQRLAAIAVIFCSVPYLSIGYAISKIIGIAPGLVALGPIEYTYTTADGLVRGGGSNSVTLTFGTAAVLAAVLLLARRIETGDIRWLWGAAAVNFASAFFHPFEFSVITTTGCLLLALEAYRTRKWRRAVTHSLVLIGAAAAGIAPYVIQLWRVQWLRDMSAIDPGTPMNFATVLLMWGMPAFLTLYSLLLGFRPRKPKDEVLAAWCIAALLLLFAFRHSPFHLLDGFTYINAMWLVRVAASDLKARAVLQRYRRPAIAFCSIWLALCAGAHATTLLQMARDGRSPDPDVLISSVAPRGELALHAWLRSHATPDDLILAPGIMAAWLITIPMHSFAAQDNWLGITYKQQFHESALFYAGKCSPQAAADFLRRYGIGWVVVAGKSPSNRYFDGRTPAASFDDLLLYHFPENHIRDYTSKPRTATDLRAR